LRALTRQEFTKAMRRGGILSLQMDTSSTTRG